MNIMKIKKNIIMILCFRIITFSIIFAYDFRAGDLNEELLLTDQKSEIQNIIKEDSVQADALENIDKVYIPFGEVSARFTTGDITVIKPKELFHYDNIFDVITAINGRVPGLNYINLRGFSGSSKVVVDGVIRSIDYVNLSEVEQITVLKDANSAMLYGLRANNGLILIKTKRGAAGPFKANVLLESGLLDPISYPKYLSAADYMELYNEARVNDGLGKLFSQNEINATRSGRNPYKYPDVDYYSSTFLKKFNTSQRVQTEFYGGSNIAQYYVNFGWNHQGSIVKLGNDK